MKKIKKVCYFPWLGTPKNNEIFTKDIGSWEYQLGKKLKEENIKIATDDLMDTKDADACIIFDNLFYKNLESIWEMYDNKILHKSIYIDYEPPTGHCKNHSPKGIRKLSKIFKKVITYNDDLVDGKRIIKGNIANFYSKELKYKHDFNDRKFVTMITNNTKVTQIIGVLNYCNTSNYYNKSNIKDHPNSIYSKREQAARYFLNKCPDKFDLYGTYWPDEFKPVLKGYLNKDKKCEILSQYKFIVSYDSFINQNGYISEKIFDAFRAKTVPIYWGANNVTDYIPKECFIDRRNFKTYDELYEFLENMTEKEYEKYIEAIEKFLKSDLYKRNFSSEASANIIKDALLSEDVDFSYKEAYKILMSFQRKKDKVDRHKKIDFYLTNLLENGNKMELRFTVVNYTRKKGIKYDLYIDGVKQRKYDINEVAEANDIKRYEFTAKIKASKKPVIIEVLYQDQNRKQYLELIDYSGESSIKYGIVTSRNHKKIMYYNYIGLSKLKKAKYLLLYNRKHLFHRLKEKASEWKYRFIRKIKNVGSEIKHSHILRRFITICYRLLKLPFLYVKDIIDVFRWN